MAFRGIQAETAQQGDVHKSIARELQHLVADPFEEWAKGYHVRHSDYRTFICPSTHSFRRRGCWPVGLTSLTATLKTTNELKLRYVSLVEPTRSSCEVLRCRSSNSRTRIFQMFAKRTRQRKSNIVLLAFSLLVFTLNCSAKFAPNSGLSDKYTTSPRLAPRDKPVRSATISERIAQSFKEIQRRAANLADDTPSDGTTQLLFTEEKEVPKVDKGKGKAITEEPESTITNSPPSLSPQRSPEILAIKTASSSLPEPPEPIILAGLSLPPTAVSELLSRASSELNLRSIRVPILGEYNNCFTGEEFVYWLNKNVQGFGGELDHAEQAARELTERENLLRRIGDLGNAFEPVDDAFYQFRPKAFELGKLPSKEEPPLSPTKLAPVAGNFMKRSNGFLNVVSKALAANPSAEPLHVRTRLEADAADREYRISVRKLDRQRLGLEERIEETLRILQRWETERLHAE